MRHKQAARHASLSDHRDARDEVEQKAADFATLRFLTGARQTRCRRVIATNSPGSQWDRAHQPLGLKFQVSIRTESSRPPDESA